MLEEDDQLTFAQFSKLNKTLAVFLEAVRMYPAGHSMIRTCNEHTVLKVSSPSNFLDQYVLPKDSLVIVDVIGIREL